LGGGSAGEPVEALCDVEERYCSPRQQPGYGQAGQQDVVITPDRKEQTQRMDKEGKVLILTVGQGTVDKLEETLVTPFRRSFEDGQWQRIVLLPSKETERNARLLVEQFPQFPLEVRALRKPGQEDNTDACFRHFDDVIRRLLDEGFRAENCTADVTRGTKAMTAALAMAAMAHRLGCLRYITGKRDERGMVIADTESVVNVAPERALQRLDVNRAVDYLRAGNYRAVEMLFPGAPKQLYEGHMKEEIRFLAWAGQFWGAWDRFDYKSARLHGQRNGMPTAAPPATREFLPSDEQLLVLETLAGEAPPKARDNAGYCRALAADLLANAERRLAEGQNEEVLVRLYRVLELLGQLRLFLHGIDTGAVRADDERVSSWIASRSLTFQPNERGLIQIPRQLAADLLLFLEKQTGSDKNTAIAQKLKDVSWLGEWGPEMRNTSILIHGFRARSRGREKELRDLLEKIRALYFDEDSGNEGLYQACRFEFLRVAGDRSQVS